MSKKLASLSDVERVQKGIFIIPTTSEDHKAILQLQPSISFIKTRRIPSIKKTTKDVYFELVYSIVAFSFRNPTAKQKKGVERLIKKSTGIRLRPGVVLFPILRSKQQRRIIGTEENRLLLTSSEFNKLLREHGARVYRWSRLRVINLEGSTQIKTAIQQTLLRDCSSLEERIRALRDMCKGDDLDVAQLKKNYSVLSRNYKQLKKKWITAEKIWLYDVKKPLKRTYNLLINTRRMISAM